MMPFHLLFESGSTEEMGARHCEPQPVGHLSRGRPPARECAVDLAGGVGRKALARSAGWRCGSPEAGMDRVANFRRKPRRSVAGGQRKWLSVSNKPGSRHCALAVASLSWPIP